VTFGLGGPLGSQNIEGCKEICNAFLQDGFTNLDDIWYDGGFIGGSGLQASDFGDFWPTFSGSTNFRTRIPRTFLSDHHKILHG